MNKAELISALASKTGKSQKEAQAFLEAFTGTGSVSKERIAIFLKLNPFKNKRLK